MAVALIALPVGWLLGTASQVQQRALGPVAGYGAALAAAAALAVCAPRVSDAPAPRMPYKPASPLPETDA